MCVANKTAIGFINLLHKKALQFMQGFFVIKSLQNFPFRTISASKWNKP